MGVVWTFFSYLSLLFSFSLSLEDGPILTEILPQRDVKHKTTNQQTKWMSPFVNYRMSILVYFYIFYFILKGTALSSKAKTTDPDQMPQSTASEFTLS